jgi:hypothetical protein
MREAGFIYRAQLAREPNILSNMMKMMKQEMSNEANNKPKGCFQNSLKGRCHKKSIRQASRPAA